jgi:hypothetical protein
MRRVTPEYDSIAHKVTVICPAYTQSEIVPDDQKPDIVNYCDEWMDEFFKELEYYKPPQIQVHLALIISRCPFIESQSKSIQ